MTCAVDRSARIGYRVRPDDGTVTPSEEVPKMLPYLLDVQVPMIHPVRASPGEVIAVLPGHPTRPVAVMRRIGGTWELMRVGPPNYGALITPLLDGVLSERTPGVARILAA
jgi:hypothetical protein